MCCEFCCWWLQFGFCILKSVTKAPSRIDQIRLEESVAQRDREAAHERWILQVTWIHLMTSTYSLLPTFSPVACFWLHNPTRWFEWKRFLSLNTLESLVWVNLLLCTWMNCINLSHAFSTFLWSCCKILITYRMLLSPRVTCVIWIAKFYCEPMYWIEPIQQHQSLICETRYHVLSILAWWWVRESFWGEHRLKLSTTGLKVSRVKTYIVPIIKG